MPQKTVEVGETPSDEVRLSNWGNLQQHLTAKNLDDIARDVLSLQATLQAEKDKIAEMNEKLELVKHLLADSEAIKKMIAKASDNILTRLSKLEELSKRTSNLGSKVNKPSPAILALAAEGYKRKDTKAKLERSLSFGMMNVQDQRPEFDFGRSDREFRSLSKWVTAIKGLPSFFPVKTYQKIIKLYEQVTTPTPEPASGKVVPEVVEAPTSIDLSMLSTNVLGSSSGVKDEPEFDEPMAE